MSSRWCRQANGDNSVCVSHIRMYMYRTANLCIFESLHGCKLLKKVGERERKARRREREREAGKVRDKLTKREKKAGKERKK